MDDPISALDKSVMKKIFKELFLEELKDKTRILVTHSIEYLSHFDKIILVRHGRIAKMGTLEEVQDDYFIQKLKQIHARNLEQESHLSAPNGSNSLKNSPIREDSK